MCNPGGAAAILDIKDEMQQLYPGVTLTDFEEKMGRELGVVRISLGLASNFLKRFAFFFFFSLPDRFLLSLFACLHCFRLFFYKSSTLTTYYYGNLSYPSQDPPKLGFLCPILRGKPIPSGNPPIHVNNPQQELITFPPIVLPLSIRQALMVSRSDDITFPESKPNPSQSRFVNPNLHTNSSSNSFNKLKLRVPMERR
jgi:hypothetical protein